MTVYEERFELPPETRSVPRARRMLAALVEPWRLEPVAVEAELALSELVTNAVEHGRGPVAVALRRCPAELAIEVTAEATPSVPRLRPSSPTVASGRGLRIVDAVARAWGHRDLDHRRTVWAVFDV